MIDLHAAHGPVWSSWSGAGLAANAIVGYLLVLTNQRPWPRHRTVLCALRSDHVAAASAPGQHGAPTEPTLRCPPARILTEPSVTATLSVGGLWLLYTTDLYPGTHRLPALHLLVHAHLFLAGWLFSVALIGVEPLPHRRSFLHRSLVLVLAWAAHDVLAKYVYVHPPLGVTAPAAETGGMLMFYGGDIVDVTIAIVLCSR